MAQTNNGFEEEYERNGIKLVDSEDGKLHTNNLMTSINTMEDEKAEQENQDEQKIEECSRNCLSVGLLSFWNLFDNIVSSNKTLMKKFLLLLFLVVVAGYIVAVARQFYIDTGSSIDWCRGYGMALIVFLLFVWTVVYYSLIVPYLLPLFCTCTENRVAGKFWRKAQFVVVPILMLLVAAFLIWDTSTNRRRLLSVGGLLIFIACGFILSKHPTRIRWRTVLMGLTIQFTIGLLGIRWSGGRHVFKCVGNLTETFLEYSYVGASMVYGDLLVKQEAVFAFQSLSAVFFVSMIVQVLFYLGWMQVMCLKLGWLIQVTMGTTVMESVNAVSSVFLGMTEAPLLYKPYIKDLTTSEMHAVMVGGFSTIAGTVFAAYTSFGVDAAHIITASIMTAPAALCFAKLTYPEDTKSKTDSRSITIYKSEDKSVMDAAIQGALVGVSMILGIIASVIAFVSFVAFLNDILAWFGSLAGIPNFTLETILAYLLFPVVWLLGVEPSQCLMISRLIGIKISVNEFVAYKRFGVLKSTGVLTPRTEAIATYALCSFANPGSVGILVSTLTTLCPSQRFVIIAVATRAFCCSIVVTFLTACIAGALMPEEGFTD